MNSIRYLVMAVGLIVTSFAAPPALAAPCAGFTDVEDTDQFCANIEWIRNRGITRGCNPGGTLYCPLDATPRDQMAAFLNRLGNVLTPQILSNTADTGPVDLDLPSTNPAVNLCAVGPFTPTDYPRRAIIYAQFSGLSAGALQLFGATSYSTDNGATFTRTAPFGIGMRSSVSGATRWLNVTQTATFDLDVGTSYILAFEVVRAIEDVATNDLTSGRCNMTVFITSRTGTSSPFDPAPSGALDNSR